MSSIVAQYQGVTNSARPQNNQAAIISGTIDYTARDVGQWQSDGSVILNLAGILNANPSFYPQSIIIVNPNGYSVPVSINPATVNYRITVPAGSIVRDLCLCFTQGLSIQFGAIATPSAPLEYIITNFPLAPETINLFSKDITDFNGVLSSVSQLVPPGIIVYTNSGTIPIYFTFSGYIEDMWDYTNTGSFHYDLESSTILFSSVAIEFDTTQKVINLPTVSGLLLPGQSLTISQTGTQASLPASGTLVTLVGIYPLIYNL